MHEKIPDYAEGSTPPSGKANQCLKRGDINLGYPDSFVITSSSA